MTQYDTTKIENQEGNVVDPPRRLDGHATELRQFDTGETNAAELQFEDGRTTVTAFWTTNGSATVHVEVSPFGTDWYPVETISVSEAERGTHTFQTGLQYVRVWADQNVDDFGIGAKGV